MKENVEGDGAVDFNSLKPDDQTKVLSSLPVMDNRDSSAITAKLVSVQDGLNQAKMKKLAEDKGWKFDGEKSQLLLPIPKGIGAEGDTTEYKGIQVLRMGEDANGSLVFEGRLLVDQGGKLTPSGPEVYVADAGSEFVKALVSIDESVINNQEVISQEVISSEARNLKDADIVKNLEARSMKAEESGFVTSIKNRVNNLLTQLIKTTASIVKNVVSFTVEKTIVVKNFVLGYATGPIATLLSGDFLDRKLEGGFDKTKNYGVVSNNGVGNNLDNAKEMQREVQDIFGVSDSIHIFNGKHLFGALDVVQTLCYEFLGSYDLKIFQTAGALNEGVKDRGFVFWVVHSQGAAIAEMTLKSGLLSEDVRSKIFVISVGPQMEIDAKKYGLNGAINVENVRDFVPKLGKANLLRYLDDTGSGEVLKINKEEARHSFLGAYSGTVREIAEVKIKELFGGENEDLENSSINLGFNADNGVQYFGYGREQGFERGSNLLVYDWQGIQNRNGIGDLLFQELSAGDQKEINIGGYNSILANKNSGEEKISISLWSTNNSRTITERLGVQDSASEIGRTKKLELYSLLFRNNEVERSAVGRGNSVSGGDDGLHQRAASSPIQGAIRSGSEVADKVILPYISGEEKELKKQAALDFLNNLEATDTVIAVVKGKDVVVNVVSKDEKIKKQITVETKTLAKAVAGLKDRKAETANKTNAKSAKVNDLKTKTKISDDGTVKTTTLKEKTVEVAKTLNQLTEGIKESALDSLGKIGGEGLTLMLKAGPAAWLSPPSIFAAGSNPMPEISNTFKEITGNEMTVADVKEVKKGNIVSKTWNILKSTGNYISNGFNKVVEWGQSALKFLAQPVNILLRKIGGQGSLESKLTESMDAKYNKIDDAMDSLLGNKQNTNKTTDNENNSNINRGTTFEDFLKNKDAYLPAYQKQQDESWGRADSLISAIDKVIEQGSKYVKIDARNFREDYANMKGGFKAQRRYDYQNSKDIKRENRFDTATDELNVYVLDEQILNTQIYGSYDKKVEINSENKTVKLTDHVRAEVKYPITRNSHIFINFDNLDTNSLKGGFFYGFGVGSIEVGGEYENKKLYVDIKISA